MTSENLNYDRVAKAIEFLSENFRRQPSLSEVAGHVHLSPYHFQRLFTEWAGVSPKKFLQYISIEHAKSLLNVQQPSLFDVAFETGLSGTSRLHDLFVSIEGMTPGEFRNGGEDLSINYSFSETPFGDMIVASTSKGICHMAFAENEQEAFSDLLQRFPRAAFRQRNDMLQQNALYIFRKDWNELPQIRLHLQGTAFQLKVWETLLKIPMGSLTTYGRIAQAIGNPNASRAVGSAVGDNPIAYLIPCHRVIRSTGSFGDYHWGTVRKTAMLGWEGSRVQAG
jgi:AraC family transcriptional regulator of adaptative response/methylated-DNA-[protein]-cysteine methyltransferase